MPDTKLYEVMVDTFGADDVYHRGDLLHEGDCKYDLKEALGRGVVRLAPEYEGKGLASTTMPLNADGSIDWSAQDNARVAAGVLGPEDQHAANKAALDAAQAAYEASERALKDGNAATAEDERRKRLDEAAKPKRDEPAAVPAPVVVQRPGRG